MHSHTPLARAIAIVTIFLIAALLLAFLIMQSIGKASVFDDSAARERVNVGGVPVFVHIADTSEERERGLSGAEKLSEDQGLLFVFERDGFYAIWMKDMAYAIDVLWLEENGTIIAAEHSLLPETYPQSFAPPRPARYILELPAGFLKKHGIQIGERVTI